MDGSCSWSLKELFMLLQLLDLLLLLAREVGCEDASWTAVGHPWLRRRPGKGTEEGVGVPRHGIHGTLSMVSSAYVLFTLSNIAWQNRSSLIILRCISSSWSTSFRAVERSWPVSLTPVEAYIAGYVTGLGSCCTVVLLLLLLSVVCVPSALTGLW